MYRHGEAFSFNRGQTSFFDKLKANTTVSSLSLVKLSVNDVRTLGNILKTRSGLFKYHAQVFVYHRHSTKPPNLQPLAPCSGISLAHSKSHVDKYPMNICLLSLPTIDFFGSGLGDKI